MARLIPEVEGRRLSSAAEKKLAQRFRNELSGDAVLMHSVGFVRHKKKRWAEADFVLICADGVFCLEVKGGRVSLKDGVWHFTDRTGHTDTKYEGPFDQAGGAAGSLQMWLATEGFRRASGSHFQVGYGVMTPDCLLNMQSPSVEPDILLDQRHVEASLARYVARLGEYWQSRTSSAPLTSNEVETLREAIRPDFAAEVSRRFHFLGIQDELVRLTDGQLSLLDGLSENERVVIKGAAGTGKTLIAESEVRRLAMSGLKTLLVCYSEPLARSLAASLEGTEGVEVASVGGLAEEVVESHDAVDRLPDAEEYFLAQRFRPELATELLRSAGPRYEALVIDEGQDLLSEEFIDFLDALVAGGFRSGTWRLFQDPNQNIFGRARREALDLIDSGAPAKFTLSQNCRNTNEIVEGSRMLSGAEVAALSDVGGPDVQVCTNWEDDWVNRSLGYVKRHLDDGLDPSDVVVLTASEAHRRTVAAAAPALVSTTATNGKVLVSTIADFKGFDSLAVVIAGPTSLAEPEMRQALYVGASRAKVHLTVVLPRTAEASFGERVAAYAQEKANELMTGNSAPSSEAL